MRKAVSVVIAAFDAGQTIAACVASALAEPETGEVIVVDDCSRDDTVAAAERAGGGDPRLQVVRQDINRGPSAARNRAIDAATMPYVAVLDADDRFLPGRFARLFGTTDWDFCADNIAFLTDRAAFASFAPGAKGQGRVATLDLETFMMGNRNSKAVERSELGFLKPVMRREFLDTHGLRYAANCRLGEDFLLYCRALARGARFRVHEACGYVAYERRDSLSGKHGVEDLRHFLNGIEALEPELPPSAAGPFRSLQDSLRKKIDLREVLDIRSEHGLARGVMALGTRPTALRDILRDKLRSREENGPRSRMLMPPCTFDRLAA
ncbi:glycosyltransferase family 2 protein [Qipengyuania spongiae]|uniref:Glycosyltransferase family 2 protein n=1 Tax=Qipengyuania spongiae TaxID=2909673 RepID=A0ABY5T1F1_9SPHN|nr:glycosyltransferase family 2 protein [Qipengyuania spongiae]UVI39081.1 glycosyltransferase family 2 protein [Qipengyuania spongiae]